MWLKGVSRVHQNSDFITDLLNKIELSAEAYEKTEEMLKLLNQNHQFSRELKALSMRFMFPEAHEIRRFLEKLSLLSKRYEVDENILVLVFLFISAESLYKRYQKSNINDEIFYSSVKDIKCKIDECVFAKGYIGTFIPHWFIRLFNMERFNIGRFQYEPSVIEKEITTKSGIKIEKGTKVILMHIPSGEGPITDEVRFESYKKAYDFYKHYDFQNKIYYPEKEIDSDYITDGKIIFTCHSWLLFERHREFLPENSNILRFMKDFYIYENYETEKPENIWRIYGKDDSLSFEELPEDTSLKRAYKNWLLSGNKTGGGVGLIIFDGENIIN